MLPVYPVVQFFTCPGSSDLNTSFRLMKKTDENLEIRALIMVILGNKTSNGTILVLPGIIKCCQSIQED